MFLRRRQDKVPLLVQHPRLIRCPEHAKVLRQIGRPDRQCVDPVHGRDRVEIGERSFGLEHHGHEHLPVGERPPLRGGAGQVEVGPRAVPCIAPQSKRRIA